MNNLRLLLKINLLSIINKTIHNNDKKEKRRFIGFAVLVFIVMVSIMLSAFAYSFMMAIQFEQIGAMELLPAIMMLTICILTIFTTIYQANSILFKFKDYDTLMALPIKTSIIVASRLLTIYITNLFFSMLVMFPVGLVYAIKVNPPFVFYIIFIITLLFIPMVPIIVGTIIGAVIALISSRFKHNTIVNLIVTLIFFIAIMIFSFTLNTVAVELTEINIETMQLNKIYPLINVYINAICEYDILSLVIFAGISALSFVAFSLLVGLKLKTITTLLTDVRTKSNYKLTTLKESSPFISLYKKELRRYFSSSLYVLNTAIGGIMITIMSLGILFFGSEKLEQIMEIPGFSESIGLLAPLLISFCIAMCSTTACSISLEGKNLWILKSIPVKIKDIFMSKIAVNLTVSLPVIFINVVILSIVLKLSFIQILILAVIPIGYAVFSSFLGLIANLYYPNFSWTSESHVIKRGISVFIASIVGVFFTLIPIVLILSLPESSMMINIAIIVLLSIFDSVLYKVLMSKGINIFLEL